MLLGSDVDDVEHESGRVVAGSVGQDEVLLGMLGQHRRRKGAERLPKLDLRVHEVLHVRPPRIGQNRPMSEGPRPPLEASLAPADDFPALEPVHHALDQAFLVVDPLVRNILLAQEALGDIE